MPKNKNAIEAKELKKKKADKNEKINNQVVRMFDSVLDNQEKIVKSFKPKNLSVYILNIIKPLILYLFFVVIFLFLYLFPSEELTKSDCLLFLYFITGLTLLFEICIFLITKKYLKNSLYVITNKRVMISYGFFEANFKSLDFNNVKDVQLKCSLFDKIMGKKSGQIYFYPTNKEFSSILFFAIEDPVNTYIEIENIMEKNHGKNN